jgi:disulfide bond formation protein DsbB
MVFFSACAYVFQHAMKLDPCVMCIYERVAMVSIALASLFGAINPQVTVIRWLGILAWGGASYKGMTLALEHVEYQTSIFATCSPLSFPDWAPLNKWIPSYFEASGDCSEVVWQFVGMSMPQWLVVIYTASLIAASIIAVSQFFKVK